MSSRTTPVAQRTTIDSLMQHQLSGWVGIMIGAALILGVLHTTTERQAIFVEGIGLGLVAKAAYHAAAVATRGPAVGKMAAWAVFLLALLALVRIVLILHGALPV